MSTHPKDGGPAFPSHGSMGEVSHEGMSLRDYFAAKAMQAFIIRGFSGQRDMGSAEYDETVSRFAYESADAMLRAREVQP
jgi:hypothetical protein